MAVELPLFTLGTVLFPHMPLGLHIFEERYRTMLRDCEESGTTFGVIAIREGTEVGRTAVPYDVGTLAMIRDKEQLDDGRYNLVVVGASRFRVDSLTYDRAYLVGSAHYLEDAPPSLDDGQWAAPRASLVESVISAFTRYLATLAELSEPDAQDIELPDDPELLAYIVSAALRVEVSRRQELLELDSTDARLRGCLTLLRRETSLLDRMLQRRDLVATVSPN